MITLFLLTLPLYFVPAIIAGCRNSKNGTAIFWLNFLTGWSLIGWIAAFIWACVSDTVVKAPPQSAKSELDWDRTAIYGKTKPQQALRPLWTDEGKPLADKLAQSDKPIFKD
jgi:hypothetical protein